MEPIYVEAGWENFNWNTDPCNIDYLPNEILYHIFQFILRKEWMNIYLTCKRWSKIIGEDLEKYKKEKREKKVEKRRHSLRERPFNLIEKIVESEKKIVESLIREKETKIYILSSSDEEYCSTFESDKSDYEIYDSDSSYVDD